jgi:uncharacterized protein (TIGR02145 family)
MKRIIILIYLGLNMVVLAIAQQSLTLSFEAKHYEGQDVGLDSILIRNINRNCDTMLYAPDTVLYYNFFVGLDEKPNAANSFISSTYPNPTINNKTFFNINLNKTGALKLELFDLMGRKLLAQNKDLSQGNYKYQLNLGMKGSYILKAVFKNEYRSLKIINNSTNNSESFDIDLVSEHLAINIKQEKAAGGFWYEPGDTLWYVGYAKTPFDISGSDVLEGVPIIKEHRRFYIVEGLPCPDNVAVKYAGHLYPTVEILGNCWFKENLNVGTMIVGDSNMKDNGIIEKYCYDDDPVNCKEYGGLYQWHELMNYQEEEATQGICPQGWHIPTSDEYFSLIEDFDGLGCKERGNNHWLPGYNIGGSNNKGFTALGTGYRQNDNFFYQFNEDAPFHSSTKLTNDWVWYMELNKNNHILFGSMLKITGLSVRCIKD